MLVMTDLGPSSAVKYKDDPIEDRRHHAPQLHTPRASLYHPQEHSNPPQQPTPGSYTPQPLISSFPHTSYGQKPSYYAAHAPYTAASAPGQYSSSGASDIMATTAQMQRPYPPMYHTPQSRSPASVASQPHDQHTRSIYAQSPQLASQIYPYQPYSMNPVQPPYATHHPSPQPHPLTTQPLMMPSHQSAVTQMSHQPSTVAMSSPTAATQQPTPPQRAVLNPPQPATTSMSVPTPTTGTSSTAAPGPIPATTPLVVRQDSNGVQWIAFEYSRDRVKMEYTIRCDVESVDVDTLDHHFRTENCVYPRACVRKDEYKGNRLVYETECNAVGWALAQLNPALRGKRGLIQRAVDSWRNSNQDQRLRSRRVRRMHKVNTRRHSGVPQPPAHMAAGSSIGPGMPLPPSARPGVGPMTMGPPHLHHHHHSHAPSGSPIHEEVSGTAEFTSASHHPPVTDSHRPSETDVRPAQVFHGYPAFPPPVTGGPAMPPLLREGGIVPLARPPTVATSSSRPDEEADNDDEQHPSKAELFGPLPDGKPRKFLLVEDPQRQNRVRVKVMLDQVDMDEIPDSYRMSNSVYPRSYFPVQLKNPPGGGTAPGKRFFKDDATVAADSDEAATVGRVTVPVPSLDGESEVSVPKMSSRRHRKDVMLNDLGHRMSWSQSRTFAGRILFLQRSLDAYRNKMRTTMIGAGRDPSSIPAHFETRAGKRRFRERRKRRSISGDIASQRSAEEVEG